MSILLSTDLITLDVQGDWRQQEISEEMSIVLIRSVYNVNHGSIIKNLIYYIVQLVSFWSTIIIDICQIILSVQIFLVNAIPQVSFR